MALITLRRNMVPILFVIRGVVDMINDRCRSEVPENDEMHFSTDDRTFRAARPLDLVNAEPGVATCTCSFSTFSPHAVFASTVLLPCKREQRSTSGQITWRIATSL